MTISKYIFIAFILIGALSIGCKDDGVDPKVVALNEKLAVLMNNSNAWVLGASGTVMKDGFDVSSQFVGFRLIIGNKTYNTQNSLSHVWKSSGTWDFQGGNPNSILRDDNIVISVNELNNQLTLTFTAAGNSGGARVNSVSGEYVFSLVSE